MFARAKSILKPTLKILSFVPVLYASHSLLTVDITTVSGRSMQPTFNPEPYAHDGSFKRNDLVVVKKAWLDTPWRVGDVVILRSPIDPSEYYIKRITALPGEKIKWNGKIEPIPDQYCWIEGDNLNVSADSNVFGPIPQALIYGKASHIIWPLHRQQSIESQVFPWQRRAILEANVEMAEYDTQLTTKSSSLLSPGSSSSSSMSSSTSVVSISTPNGISIVPSPSLPSPSSSATLAKDTTTPSALNDHVASNAA